MDKESIYELQKLDCNCNDCGYMVRDFARFNQSLEDHRRWQFEAYMRVKFKKLALAHFYETRNKEGDIEKVKNLRNEASEITSKSFVFDKSSNTINYGKCTYGANHNNPKPEAFVTFIPNTLQADTQHCFKHRKDFKDGKL
jgi:hypothetical protein